MAQKVSYVVQTQIAHQIALDLISHSPLVEYPRVPTLVPTVEKLRRI